MKNLENLEHLKYNYLVVRHGEGKLKRKPFHEPAYELTEEGRVGVQESIDKAVYDGVLGFSKANVIYANYSCSTLPSDTARMIQKSLGPIDAIFPPILRTEALKDRSSRESAEKVLFRTGLLLSAIEDETSFASQIGAETVILVADGGSLDTLINAVAEKDPANHHDTSSINPGEIRVLYMPQTK